METLPSNVFMVTGQNLNWQNGKCFVGKRHQSHATIWLYLRKNATDSAMIIDAMDILYSEKVNGFCIVSDSDFTKLATRLREAGMLVIGMGEKKPDPFIVACDKFIYLEILQKQSEESSDQKQQTLPITPSGQNKSKVIRLIASTISIWLMMMDGHF